MFYASGAGYDRGKRCMEDTRLSVIDLLVKWINDILKVEDAEHILLLTGVAGSGKSAIAHQLAYLFKLLGRLGSSFCFSSSNRSDRSPDMLFSTISHDLADINEGWKTALISILKKSRQVRTTRSMIEQFEEFILQPSRQTQFSDPILIVIDALDESGSVSDRISLLRLLGRISELPVNLRFLITSRPDDDILKVLLRLKAVRVVNLDEVDPNVTTDIQKFIDHELGDLPQLRQKWPHKEWLPQLTSKSGQLFQWASTACKFIRGDGEEAWDSDMRMKLLLEGGDNDPNKAGRLDDLYLTILKQKFNFATRDTADLWQNSYRVVMGYILMAYEPLSTQSLMDLHPEDDKPVEIVSNILRRMGSLLQGVTTLNSAVKPLHASFRDFLLSSSRSSPYNIEASDLQHEEFSRALLQTMINGLKFNICGLETSYLRNAQVPNLDLKIEKNIPPLLSYASRYWPEHVSLAQLTSTLLHFVEVVMRKKLLYWLEIMSLIKQIKVVPHQIRLLQEWHQVSISIFYPYITLTSHYVVGGPGGFCKAFGRHQLVYFHVWSHHLREHATSLSFSASIRPVLFGYSQTHL